MLHLYSILFYSILLILCYIYILICLIYTTLLAYHFFDGKTAPDWSKVREEQFQQKLAAADRPLPLHPPLPPLPPLTLTERVASDPVFSSPDCLQAMATAFDVNQVYSLSLSHSIGPMESIFPLALVLLAADREYSLRAYITCKADRRPKPYPNDTMIQ
jgi:hypothetical protein